MAEKRKKPPEAPIEHIYRYGDQVWTVDERDRVIVKEGGKEKALGYNHSRCHAAVMHAATKK